MAIQTRFLRKPTVAGPGRRSIETCFVARLFKPDGETARHADYRRTWIVDGGADDKVPR